MTIAKVFCDHCGMVLDGIGDYADLQIEICHKKHDVDLCANCFEKLDYKIKEFCGHQKAIEANKYDKGEQYLNRTYSKDVKINGSKND